MISYPEKDKKTKEKKRKEKKSTDKMTNFFCILYQIIANVTFKFFPPPKTGMKVF